MSRCVLDNETLRTEVVIGWDPGIQSFFARVWDRTLFDQQKASSDIDEPGLQFWTGNGDRSWRHPDKLIELIQPYACSHDAAQLRIELLADQQTDNERSYSLCDDEEPESDLPEDWTPIVGGR